MSFSVGAKLQNICFLTGMTESPKRKGGLRLRKTYHLIFGTALVEHNNITQQKTESISGCRHHEVYGVFIDEYKKQIDKRKQIYTTWRDSSTEV